MAPRMATRAQKPDADKDKPGKITLEDNWRDQMAAGDKDLAKALKRYNSPDAVARAMREAQAKITSGDLQPTLPDDASDEQVAAYRESMGIPEEPSGYKPEFPEQIQLDDNDKELLGEFYEHMHNQHATPAHVQAAIDWYSDALLKQAQDFSEVRQNRYEETQRELGREWGEEAKVNINIAKRFFDAEMAAIGQSPEDLRNVVLADGTRLGDNTAFVKLFASLGRANAGTTDLDFINGAPGSLQSVDARLDELQKLMVSDKPEDQKKYWSDEVQAEVSSLYERKERLGGRKEQSQS